MKSSIKDAAKSHYQQATLNDESMSRLSAMLEEEKQAVSTSWFSSIQFKPQLIAVCFLVFFGAGLLLLPGSPQSIEMDIAKEVVKNHIKMKPLEIESNDIKALRNYFTELDFSLVQTQRYAGSDMLGARYCSIQGVTAAQLRYQSPASASSDVISIYEVEYDPVLFGDIPDIDKGLVPKEITMNGLSVKLWVEKGLLMVSVAEISQAF